MNLFNTLSPNFLQAHSTQTTVFLEYNLLLPVWIPLSHPGSFCLKCLLKSQVLILLGLQGHKMLLPNYYFSYQLTPSILHFVFLAWIFNMNAYFYVSNWILHQCWNRRNTNTLGSKKLVVKSMILEPDYLSSNFSLCLLTVLWPWASYLSSLCLTFLGYKIVLISKS